MVIARKPEWEGSVKTNKSEENFAWCWTEPVFSIHIFYLFLLQRHVWVWICFGPEGQFSLKLTRQSVIVVVLVWTPFLSSLFFWKVGPFLNHFEPCLNHGRYGLQDPWPLISDFCQVGAYRNCSPKSSRKHQVAFILLEIRLSFLQSQWNVFFLPILIFQTLNIGCKSQVHQ